MSPETELGDEGWCLGLWRSQGELELAKPRPGTGPQGHLPTVLGLGHQWPENTQRILIMPIYMIRLAGIGTQNNSLYIRSRYEWP